MASNSVVLKGTTYNGVSSLEVPKSGGGTALFTDVSDTTAAAADVASGKYFYDALGAYTAGTASGGGSDSWSWMGKNPTKIKTYTKERVYFKNTNFPNWTWSTSQSVIVPAAAYGDTVTVDFTQYDVAIVYKLYVHTEYGNWTPIKAVTDYSFVGGYFAYGAYTNLTAKQSGVYNGMAGAASGSKYSMYYANASGITTLSQNYVGLYAYATTTVANSGSVSSKVLTITKPNIYAVGSNNYFTQDAFNNVDMDASYYEIVTEVWRVDAPTSYDAAIYDMTINIIDNGL